MPKATVDNAIKRASSKDQEDYKEMVYEGYGQHGVAILVECTTDNTNRSIANIRSHFTKCGGTIGTSGMLDFIFDRKSEEVFLDEEANQINIYGEFTAFGALQKHLEEKGYELLHSDFERVPTDTKELTEEQAADIEKLIERLEDDDDVQNIYHNMVVKE
jgi:transcriptional/translational regulatory protein YebC/TACO1